jgi:hypothetical protein
MAKFQGIGSAVGRQPALNSIRDQLTVITLLHRVLPEDGGPGSILPTPTGSQASRELIDAILNFQKRHAPRKFQDGRVDPNGFTIRKLNELARSIFPVDPIIPPIDPFPPPEPKPKPPKPPLPPTPPFLASLGFSASSWRINGSATSLSFGVGPGGGGVGRFTLLEDGDPEPHLFDYAGISAGLGPFPFSADISPSFMPGVGTRIFTKKPDLSAAEIKGACSIVAASTNVGLPGGPNAAIVFFGVRASLQNSSRIPLLALLRAAHSVGATGGTFIGLNVGVSILAGAMV